ncbi:MAG: type II toxin-antitoxin system VapC family toxin [Coriobacteriales bacterium]|jgi:PIN domain nuclease of toxin-antitoxin system|nr:type II toxin-antitoxin system VapC family toxin [Coriobacteriales bacterium]
MRLLLDTQVLLWAAKGTAPSKPQSLLEDTANDLFFSPVNLWEIELKKSKLNVDLKTFYQNLIRSGYQELTISSRHILALSSIPDLHNDPFDRMLLAQAFSERLTLLTADEMLIRYGNYLDCIIQFR